MMKRCAFLSTLVAGIGLCPSVQAQEITCEITRLGEETYTGADNIDVGSQECENAVVTFSVKGLVNTYYAKTGPGCDSDTGEKCYEIPEASGEMVSGSDTFEISLTELLDKYEQTCADANVAIRVRVFSENSMMDESGNGKACTTITVDTSGPEVPTGVRGEPGESEIKVFWTKVSGAEKYNVYYKVIDDCEDTVKAAEEAVDDNPDAQVVADAGTYDPDEREPNWLMVNDFDENEPEEAQNDHHVLRNKAEPGEELLIRVAAVDESENQSSLSEPICITVIRTRGFCDSTDICKDGCSVGPLGKENVHASAGVVVGLLTLFALVWARRRSRS